MPYKLLFSLTFDLLFAIKQKLHVPHKSCWNRDARPPLQTVHSFQPQTDDEDRLKIAFKKMTTHPAHRTIDYVFPDRVSFLVFISIFNNGLLRPLLDLFKHKFYIKNVGVSSIRTRIVKLESKYGDHDLA